jgi:hypothetical protein
MLSNWVTTLVLLMSIVCIIMQSLQKRTPASILVAAAPIPFLLFDQIFYQGIIVDHYLTNKVVATVWACVVVIEMLNDTSFSRKHLSFAVVLILAVASLPLFQNGYNRIQSHMKATISFANGLDEVVKSKNNYSQVAFIVQSGWDYESIFSTLKQLRGRGDVRPYFLLISKKYELSDDPSVAIFIDWSKNGLPGDLYSPISHLNANEQIICYYSEYAPILVEQCDDNVVLKWLPQASVTK